LIKYYKLNMKITISHIKPPCDISQKWEIQSNDDHSKGVAKLAALFAKDFGFYKIGEIIGLLHDKGKEQEEFQHYIQGITGYNPNFQSYRKIPHAYVGALIAKQLYPQLYPLLSSVIIAHHRGLYDYGDFEQKMKNEIPKDVDIKDLNVKPDFTHNLNLLKEDIHHLFRVLYSCLVDADFLDTESFMNGINARIRKENNTLSLLLPKLNLYLNNLNQTSKQTEINKLRKQIQNLCLESSKNNPGFYSLTVPTGGGKTLSSLIWAINHAITYQKRRVIIAIPYTSIITQTAQILRNIFGEENVLEHHSNTIQDAFNDKTLELKMKLATENWDYPIVVTTNVQLFESIFSNKPSSCRKLHNICNSVLILDEVQTLPLEFLQPIIDCLKTYRKLFGTSILFTTASLPAFDGNFQYFKGLEEIKEIIPEELELPKKFHRVDLHFDKEVSNYDQIVTRLKRYNRVLCIVNTRKDAQEIFSRLPKEGLSFHLSRMMCSQHIIQTIEKLKAALSDEKQKIIRVISTQLIEAGVDIDFPIVFRQEAGLDSILQAAGRCNREGRLLKSDAYVFSLGNPPRGYISNACNALKNMEDNDNWFDPKTIKKYFIQLYSRIPSFDKADIKRYLYNPFDFSFETAANSFKLIDDNSISVIVNYGSSPTLIEQLKSNGPSYSLMKELGQYTVNLHEGDFNELNDNGLIDEFINGFFFIPSKEQYDDKIGLVKDNHWLEEILIK
jgi:CRISPR-associated endonuclease/helicase Cas3